MSEKLKKFRDRLTEKQVKFVELHKSGQDRGEAYQNAGYKPKDLLSAQVEASRLLTKNVKVIAYFEALKAEDDRKTNITRTMQLNALRAAQELAQALKNPSAMVSAIREMNEMLGYHRELAPNAEAEAARKARMDAERRKVAEKVAKMRTDEESGEAKTIRIREGA